MPDGAVQQPFGSAATEALGEHQHTDGADPPSCSSCTPSPRSAPRYDPSRSVRSSSLAASSRRSTHRPATTPISKRSRHRSRAARPIEPSSASTRSQPGGDGADVARGHEHTGLAVGDHLGHRPDSRGDGRDDRSGRPRSARRACPRSGWRGRPRRPRRAPRPDRRTDAGELHPTGCIGAGSGPRSASRSGPSPATSSAQARRRRARAAIADPTSFSAVSEPT